MGNKGERRRSTRHELRIPVDYSSVDAFFSEMATNINEGGMFIATDSPAGLDEVVKLAFSLPGLSEPVEVNARVVWINDGSDGTEPGMGVAFQELSTRARETINTLVRRLRTVG
jgi:uncharacterized protein (TIGR02266 family)